MSLLAEAVIFLAAAVVTVPLFRRLGLGAVLGYLAAGALIGPPGLHLVTDVEHILHMSELGIVLLLFIIGLELQPTRLWALRRPILGMGTAQVLVTGVLLSGAGLAAGLPPATAAVIGFALSLSSTAFALQLLAEKRQLTTHHGRASFAVLLFQDIAAIPLIAVIPLLAAGAPGLEGGNVFLDVALAAGAIAALVVGGHWLLRPFFRLIAAAGIHEIFTAAGLLLVIGAGLLMEAVGLSMGLGAFLAGVLVADSEYRHELEADIEPFKGLLLGLFFIAVGMSVDLGVIAREPLTVAGLVLGLVAIKGAVLYALGRRYGLAHAPSVKLALYLSQGGEFAFVVFSVASAAGMIDGAVPDLLVVVVSLSMVLTPLLVAAQARFAGTAASGPQREFDTVDVPEGAVIIAGFGRVGQVVARTLRSRRIPFTALEASFEQVDFVRRFGNKIYFGDASRLELLRAAGAERARAFVLAIDDVESSIRTAEMVRRHFPQLRIYARARNRHHAYRLLDVGVDRVIRETFGASLEIAREVLLGLGYRAPAADEVVRRFRAHDEALFERQRAFHHDETRLMASAREAAEELERLFEEDTIDPRADGGTAGLPRPRG